MVNKNSIREMYELQKDLNDKTNGEKWKKSGITREGRVIDWNRCIYMEVAEGIDSLNWKHWAHISKKDDIDNLKIEMVDTWHFIMSEHIRKASLDKAIDEATEGLINCGAKKFPTMLEGLEAVMLKSLQKQLPLYDFFKLVNTIPDFSMNDVYKLYIGKNCLNAFRQINGYKEGEYQKIWDGQEDNVYMKSIVENTNNLSYDILYEALLEKYTEVISA